MREESLASYLIGSSKALEKYVIRPVDLKDSIPNIFWYCPSLLAVTNGKNWVNSRLENMQSPKLSEIVNYGVITLDVTFDILETGDNRLIYEDTYMGIKVKPSKYSTGRLIPFSKFKNREYKGISFNFPRLLGKDYLAIISEIWHIGFFSFRKQTTFNIIVRETNKSKISNLNRIATLNRFLYGEKDKILISDEGNINEIDDNVRFTSIADNYNIGMQSFTWPSSPYKQAIRFDPMAGIAYLSSYGCSNSKIKNSLNMISTDSGELSQKWLKSKEFISSYNLNKDLLCANLRVCNSALKSKSPIVQYTYSINTTIRNLSPFEVIALKKYSYSIVINPEPPIADLTQIGLSMELPKII